MATAKRDRIPVDSRMGGWGRPGLEADFPLRSQLCVNEAVEERSTDTGGIVQQFRLQADREVNLSNLALFVADAVDDCVGDIIWCDANAHAFGAVSADIFEHRGVDVKRPDCLDIDAMGFPLDLECLRDAANGELGGGVGGHVWGAVDC